jgi:outer membrane protein TolC
MRRTRLIFIPCFLLTSSLYLTSCGDYKGASESFSYAPLTAESVWIPPKILRREPINFDNVDPYEIKDKKLSLAEVIDIALFNNPTTQNTWAEARQAAAAYGQSLQNYYVLSNLTSDYSNYQEAFFTSLNATNVPNSTSTANNAVNTIGRNTFHGITYGAQLNLSYTILDFGQTRATSKAALQALYQADFSHNDQLQSTVNLIMNDYYSYLSQKAQVEAAEQDVINAQVSLDAVLERFKNGLADVGDKVQATTRLLQQKLTLVSQKKQLTITYTDLLHDMGFPANAYLTFESYPEKIQLFEIADLDTLLKIAMNNKPSLLAAESFLKSKEEQFKLAKAQRYPVVTGTFEVGRENANLGVGSYYDYDLTFSLNFPLFQGYFIENGIRKAQAGIEIGKAKLREIQLSVTQEVTTYFNNVLYAKETYHYAKEFLESANTDFKVHLEQYKAGTSTIVDLIQAQTSVSSAQSQLIQSEKEWYSSIANLAYATGSLTNKPQLDVQIQEGAELTPCSNAPSDDNL